MSSLCLCSLLLFAYLLPLYCTFLASDSLWFRFPFLLKSLKLPEFLIHSLYFFAYFLDFSFFSLSLSLCTEFILLIYGPSQMTNIILMFLLFARLFLVNYVEPISLLFFRYSGDSVTEKRSSWLRLHLVFQCEINWNAHPDIIKSQRKDKSPVLQLLNCNLLLVQSCSSL